MLYGLIHVRFILTSRGMSAMFEKYKVETASAQMGSRFVNASSGSECAIGIQSEYHGRCVHLMLPQVCEFGRCPRVLCNGQPCLPVGTADVPRQSTVKIFCPKCKDIYFPRSKYQVAVAVRPSQRMCYQKCAPGPQCRTLLRALRPLLQDRQSSVPEQACSLLLQGNVDGAYFGTTFPHLLLMTYPSLRPPRATEAYTPRVFGFKLHASADSEAAEVPLQPFCVAFHQT